MSRHIFDEARYLLNLPNTPGFNTNPNATVEEQEDVFLNPDSNTGPVDHGYSAMDSGVGDGADSRLYTTIVGNAGSLVVAPNQIGWWTECSSF